MPTDTVCSDTLYVHTNPAGLPSFAEECSFSETSIANSCEEEEGFYKFLPANTADRLCQSWQSCSNHHKI